MKKKSSRPYHPYHDFKKRDKIINDAILSYKNIFFNWLKHNYYYNFYRDAYYVLNGNTCDFNKLIVSYLRKDIDNFMLNDLKVSVSFFQATIGCHSGNDYFRMDDIFDKLYKCRIHWESYISNYVSSSIREKYVLQLKSHL